MFTSGKTFYAICSIFIALKLLPTIKYSRKAGADLKGSLKFVNTYSLLNSMSSTLHVMCHFNKKYSSIPYFTYLFITSI